MEGTLKVIRKKTFSQCAELKEVTIPEGVIRIEEDAFEACRNLEKVVFPQSLIAMSNLAFYGTKISKSEELKEIYDRLNKVKTYQKPDGYREMVFDGMKLYYEAESVDRQNRDLKSHIGNIYYEYEISAAQSIYSDENGKRMLRIFTWVPTFDYSDREWNSYRKLFLIPGQGEITGVMVLGGAIYKPLHMFITVIRVWFRHVSRIYMKPAKNSLFY